MHNETTVRPLRSVDLPSVLEIEQRVMPFGWNLPAFQLCLYNRAFEGWILETLDGLIGYCNLYFTNKSARLLNLCVDRPFQRRGYGRQLLEFALKRCRTKKKQELFLEVRVSNEVAQNLYRNLGFRKIEQWYDYYEAFQGREHANIFAVDLSG